MTVPEEFQVHSRALSFVRNQTKQDMQDVLTAYRGMGHLVNLQAAEIEDLWKKGNFLDQEVLGLTANVANRCDYLQDKINQQASEIKDLWTTAEEMQKALQAFAAKEHELTVTVEKMANYLRKKFPEDFKKETKNDDT